MGSMEEPSVGSPPVPKDPDVELRTWEFVGHVDDIAAVRHLLSEALQHHEWEETHVQVVQLLASELATNAVMHAGGPFAVTAWVDGAATVAVTDGNPAGHPVIAERELGQGGMGLRLLAALAQRWGVHRRHDGKSVWFEFDPEAG